MVPIKCYIPAGTDCSWYKECLETRIACESTNERYAITYAEKYCKLYGDRYARFSDKGKVWIDAVRKCCRKVSTPKFVRADPKNTGDSFPWLTSS